MGRRGVTLQMQSPHYGMEAFHDDSLSANESFDEEARAEELARAQLEARREQRRTEERAREQREMAQQQPLEASEVLDASFMEEAANRTRVDLARQSQSLGAEVQLGFRIDALNVAGDVREAPEAAQTPLKLPNIDAAGRRQRLPARRGSAARGGYGNGGRGAMRRRGSRSQTADFGTDSLPRRAASGEADAEEAPDTFVPLENMQPPQFETIRLAPGVAMAENGRERAAETRRPSKLWDYAREEESEKTPDVVDDFAALVARRAEAKSRATTGTSLGATPAPAASAAASAVEAPSTCEAETSPTAVRTLGRCASLPAATGSMSATKLPPAATLPQVPGIEVRWRQRFRTLGFQPSGRQRIPTSGTQAYKNPGFRYIRAQPPIGATMGHGLVADTTRNDWP